MMQSEQKLAEILKNGARALAAYGAAEAETDDVAAASPAQFESWQNLLAARLEDLAVAIGEGRAALFVEQVLWTAALLKARGVGLDAFRAKLQSLRHVLMEEIPAELAPLAVGYVDCALADLGREPAGMAERLTADSAEEQLAAKYLVAVLEGDRREASRLILAEADAGRSVADLCRRVLQPAQEELGRMWVLGEINVAEEHFATTTTRRVMTQLQSRAPCSPANGKTLVAAAVAGNLHDLGIQMVADMFENRGWQVVQLGANVPSEDLAQAVEFYSPDLVALAISLVSQMPALKEAISAIRASQAGARTKILVGGCKLANMAELVRSHGADGYAADVLEAVEMGAALVGLTPAN